MSYSCEQCDNASKKIAEALSPPERAVLTILICKALGMGQQLTGEDKQDFEEMLPYALAILERLILSAPDAETREKIIQSTLVPNGVMLDLRQCDGLAHIASEVVH